ncbi:MAG: methionyl-tRNA formyltransferase [Victivallales bacterium]|nr:methionyl-tRNA formyltransferase [Victivallales bacterium]
MNLNNKKCRVYFFGSGEVGIPVLEAIHRSPLIELVGIGTQIDKIGGRKRNLVPTPVAIWAEKRNLKVDKFRSVNSAESLKYLKDLEADIFFVASFGQIFKEEFLRIPKVDCVNIHASLLPQYRGASPITSSILNGDRKTGITFMGVELGVDSGPIYKQCEYQMNFRETTEELEKILAETAGRNAVETLLGIFNGTIKPKAQKHDKATYVPKIRKHDGKINWTEKAQKIERMVRGYYPWPGAYFNLVLSDRQKQITITSASVCDNINEKPGKLVSANKREWIIACGEGALMIDKLIPEGKKEMSGAEFLRGCRIKKGDMAVI